MKVWLSDDVNDPDYRAKKAESVEELKELITDITRWINTDIKIKAHKADVKYFLSYLNFIVKHCPEEAQAALCGANAVWFMLLGDAWTGAGIRHLRKKKPYGSAETQHRDISQDEVLKQWDSLHQIEPAITKTQAAKKIAKSLGCSQRTIWTRFKELGK